MTTNQIQVQDTDRVANPVPVQITNWAPPAKPPEIKNTSLKTYVLDSAGVAGPTNVQISDFEPRRVRTAIWVLDQNITLLTSAPNAMSNLGVSATVAAEGALLPVSNIPYEFFGPDAFWINSLNSTARVIVVKEYC